MDLSTVFDCLPHDLLLQKLKYFGTSKSALNLIQNYLSKLNVLKRMGKYLNRLGKLTIYHSFILSNFNYCPVIWHFCSEANTKKIEKFKREH